MASKNRKNDVTAGIVKQNILPSYTKIKGQLGQKGIAKTTTATTNYSDKGSVGAFATTTKRMIKY